MLKNSLAPTISYTLSRPYSAHTFKKVLLYIDLTKNVGGAKGRILSALLKLVVL